MAAAIMNVNEAHASPEEKIEKLTNAGFPYDIAFTLVQSCKKTATNPVRCIKLGASVLGAESSKGTRCYNNNCVGM